MTPTRFTDIVADSIEAKTVNGGKIAKAEAKSISFAADHALSENEKGFSCIAAEATAASKKLTLGLGDGICCMVANVGGTNEFTVCGKSGDTGTSIAAGKIAFVICSDTENASKILVLN